MSSPSMCSQRTWGVATEPKRIGAWVLAASLGCHAAIVMQLLRTPLSRAVVGATPMQVRMVDPKSPAPQPEPEVEPAPAEEPPPAKPRPLMEPAQPAAVEPTPQAANVRPDTPDDDPNSAEPERPVDLSGITLTNDKGTAGWAAPRGDGSARSGALRTGTPPRSRRAVAAAETPKQTASKASSVALADLARPPSPPRLESVLQRHYPVSLRERGIGGSAVVRARVDADGRVRSATVTSESEPGFGAACQSTVLGSRWSPPMNKQGNAVATHVRYVCRFRVDG
ncbi:MAG: TonB family protein [Polyangiaceae bacterium]